MITTITPEFSTQELQELIDGLPPYWMEYYHDEYTHQTVGNPQNFIRTDYFETTEGIYDWIQYYINWIDGSIWSYTYCCDGYDGPYEIGCQSPPEHTCKTPPGFYGGWNSAPLVPDSDDIPF
jgi:hypothetical protein